jgi:hypothetical protein
MDTGDLIDAGTDPDATQIIDRYLSELDRRLPVRRGVRAGILAEIGDGLHCAVDERVRLGAAGVDAAHAAVAESGDPAVVAGAFAGQLGAAFAHRLGVALVATGPLVGLTWVAAYTTDGVGWQSRIATLMAALPQLPLILAVTVPAAIIASAGAGWVARQLRVPARRVSTAALVASTGCVAGDVSLLASAAAGHVRHDHAAAGLLMLAVAVSVARLSLAALAGHRIRRLRAAGN